MLDFFSQERIKRGNIPMKAYLQSKHKNHFTHFIYSPYVNPIFNETFEIFYSSLIIFRIKHFSPFIRKMGIFGNFIKKYTILNSITNKRNKNSAAETKSTAEKDE